MAIRPIRCYPDPLLRQRCSPVERFDEELRRLAGDLVDTMLAAPGVGLAAPQVGEPVRLAVVDVSVGEDAEQLHVLVNPVIVSAAGSAVETEGCLSIPEVTEKVERPAEVEVAALDLDGRPLQLAASGWLARALCHEIDHLDGVLFIDRISRLKRNLYVRKRRKQLRQEAAESDSPQPA
jgi:peptide deformylase